MKVIYGDRRVLGVVKPVQRLDVEHEHDGHVEEKHEDENGENSHPGGRREVTLAVVGGGKNYIVVVISVFDIVGLDLVEGGKGGSEEGNSDTMHLRLHYWSREQSLQTQGIYLD